ncbi:MAG: hypothetical protein AB7H90_03315 [Alphaproteobacteria bacterium]
MLFQLGRVVATRSIANRFNPSILRLLAMRHGNGDWGDVDAEDWEINNQAVKNGDRILSVYNVDGATVWIITEADRSVTTILLPEEY